LYEEGNSLLVAIDQESYTPGRGATSSRGKGSLSATIFGFPLVQVNGPWFFMGFAEIDAEKSKPFERSAMCLLAW
jgi:hypothetical protein